jgi:hypothetical protein
MKLGFIQPALSVLILTQLTHDLFSNCVASYNVDMEKTLVYNERAYSSRCGVCRRKRTQGLADVDGRSTVDREVT